MDILGTIRTVGDLVKELTLYCIAVREAPSDAKKLRDEMALVLALLTSVKEIFQNAPEQPSQWGEIPATLKTGAESLMTQFDLALQEFSERLDTDQVRGVRRLVWPFKANDNIAMTEKISRFNQALTVLLGAELL